MDEDGCPADSDEESEEIGKVLAAFVRSLTRSSGMYITLGLKRVFGTGAAKSALHLFAAPAKWFRPSQLQATDVIKSRLAAGASVHTVDIIKNAIKNPKTMLIVFKNIVPVVVSNTLVGVVLFSSYEELSNTLPPTLENQFVAGGVAGFNHAVFVSPLEIIRSEIIRKPEIPSYYQATKSFIHRRGFFSLWRSFIPAAVRDVSAFSLFFGCAFGLKNSIIRRYEIQHGSNEYIAATLVGGGLGGIAAEFCCHSVNLLRDRALQEERSLTQCWKGMSKQSGSKLIHSFSYGSVLGALIPGSLGYLVFSLYEDDQAFE